MRPILKDSIRFAVALESGAPAELEIRVRPDRFGGWKASAVLHGPGAPAPAPLRRTFRARERGLAAGKMVAWVRGRYPGAQPLRSAPSRRPGARPVPALERP